MNRAINKSTLQYLGPDFQYKLAKCFIEEPGYFASIYSVVEQNAFTEPLLRQFVGTLKDYYSSTGIVPSYETLLIVLKQKARMENELEEWDELVKNLRELSPEGTTIIEESATRFFMQQNMIKVANDILKKTQDGDTDHYEECLKMMEDAINVGNEDDEGFNPYDVIDEVMRPNAEIPIPTGISKIDDLLNGGLYKGHLGMVLGPSGFGKTTYSTAIAAHAATAASDLNEHKGWKVLQIVFEDDVRAISRKHFSRITQIEACNLTKTDEVEEARTILDNFPEKEMFRDNLIVKKYKTGTKSVEDIKIYIKRLINKGFRPDLIILDYFECLKLIRKERNDTKWDLQENTMRQLEVLAEEFNVALWVMTQGNKESFAAKVVGMNQGGGSITKVQIGHVILSIARSQEDIDNNIATIAMLKNRQGKSGPAFDNIKFNNGTCTISCDEVVEYDNELVFEEAMRQKEHDDMQHKAQQIMAAQRAKDEVSEKVANVVPNKEPEKPVVEEKPAVVEQKETITEIPDDPVLETKTEYTKVPVSDSGKLTLSINKPVVNTPKLDFEVDEIDPELAVSEAEFLNGVL